MLRTNPGVASLPKRKDSCGFTLLEVLAAVAILAIWYMVMASIATQGLRAEGESQRRLRASLLADSILVDLESNQVLGIAPPVQTEEEEHGDFTVRTEVEPYSLEFAGPSDGANPEGRSEPALQKLVQTSGESLIRKIRVEVVWWEGSSERRVSRESFALDLTPVLDDLTALAPEESAAEANDDAAESEPSLPEGDSGA